MKVLVVDDSEDMRVFVSRALALRGHDVVACADAESAWDAWHSGDLGDPGDAGHSSGGARYPLIILDWLLPGMDGLTLCRRLRAEAAGEWPVVLVITSNDRPEHVAAVLDAGATDYLPKPFGVGFLDIRLEIAERQVAEIARRKEAEAARERAERALRAEHAEQARLQGALLVARTVAHEINNAISPVTGYAELLAMRPEIARSPALSTQVAAIGAAAAQVSEKVRTLQRMVRIREIASALGPDRPLLDLERSASH